MDFVGDEVVLLGNRNQFSLDAANGTAAVTDGLHVERGRAARAARRLRHSVAVQHGTREDTLEEVDDFVGDGRAAGEDPATAVQSHLLRDQREGVVIEPVRADVALEILLLHREALGEHPAERSRQLRDFVLERAVDALHDARDGAEGSGTQRLQVAHELRGGTLPVADAGAVEHGVGLDEALEHVGEREIGDDHVVGREGDLVVLVDAQREAEKRLVSHDDALRVAGGSRGEADRADVVGRGMTSGKDLGTLDGTKGMGIRRGSYP